MDEHTVKKGTSSLLYALKRKFTVLLCFVLASVVILHLLTNNHRDTEQRFTVLRRDHQKPTLNYLTEQHGEDDLHLQNHGDDEPYSALSNDYSISAAVSGDIDNDIPESDSDEIYDENDDIVPKEPEVNESDNEEDEIFHTEKPVKLVKSQSMETIYHTEKPVNLVGRHTMATMATPKRWESTPANNAIEKIFHKEKPVKLVKRQGVVTMATPMRWKSTNTDNEKDIFNQEKPVKINKRQQLIAPATSVKRKAATAITKTRNQQTKSYSERKHNAIPVRNLDTKNTSKAHVRRASADCFYEGLGGENLEVASGRQTSCIPHKRTKTDCRKAFEYFEEYTLQSEPPQCDEESVEKICNVETKYRFSWKDDVIVKCNARVCKDESSVLIGCRDKKYGTIPEETEWQSFSSIKELEDELPAIIRKNSKRVFHFCFMKCSQGEPAQSLIFPPILKRAKDARPAINVNILLEDALSRPHFYRSLPKTVKTLRHLKRDSDSGGIVLDFELLQSYASFTLTNLQMLFTGKELPKTKSRDNGISRLFSRFKNAGYETLAQEDLCFFDSWGSTLSPSYKDEMKPFTSKFKDLYKDYQKTTGKYLDSTGLTHFACETLSSLGHTNPFKGIKNICHNGKFMSEYVLKYTTELLSVVENVKGAAPVLVYTHLNTAHESSGERIRSDDIPLADFVRNASRLENTITIMFSDHGSKTTKYSISTFQGRLEVFSPFMFIIIPEKVTQFLGQRNLKALISNQKRLTSLADLHKLLGAIMNPSRMLSKTSDVNGLLAPIPLNRTCADIKGLSTDAYCRCQGWNHFINSNSHTVYWLAEIALGEINNRISAQYRSGMQAYAANSLAYGACVRFVGKSIEEARQEMAGKFLVTTFVLVVEPAWGAKSTERFEVRLNHSSLRQQDGARVENILRLSVYGKYEACRDRSVDVRLCACALTRNAHFLRRPSIKRLMEARHFGIKTETRFLNSKCLVFGVRKWNAKVIYKLQSRVMVFEIGNQCRRTSFLVKFGGTSRKSLISRRLPFSFRVEPRTVTFLYAVNNAWKYGSFRPLMMLAPDPISGS